MAFLKRHVSKIVLALAILAFVLGILLEEPVMILDHGIRICLGCIGIG